MKDQLTGRKRFSIVTPCFNAERYLAETIDSVLAQRAWREGRVELELLICDGGSTDGTLAIARSYEERYPEVRVLSRPDNGMYEALARGLGLVTGDVLAYLNAGDYYAPQAFDIVDAVMGAGGVDWVTGYRVTYNELSQVVHVRLPYRFRSRFFACGYHGLVLPFVQQESTFWSRRVHEAIPLDELAAYRYAGDHLLWLHLSRVTELAIVQGWLGGFKVHRGQKSENLSGYLEELRGMVGRPRLLDRVLVQLDRLLWSGPDAWKLAWNARGIFVFDHGRQVWRRHGELPMPPGRDA